MRASSSERVVLCPASLVLPKDIRPAGDAAEYGTLVHHWMETGETNPAWGYPSHIRVLEEKISRTGIERATYWPGGEHEVSYALHLETEELQRYSGEPGGRDDWKAAFAEGDWLTGTVDWIGPGHLDDLKTGRWRVEARGNRQLISYALFVWVELGKPSPWSTKASITQWPKYPLDGLPERRSTKVSDLRLMEHLDDLRYSRDNPDETNPDAEGSGICYFCDSRAYCPAWRPKPERRSIRTDERI